MKMFERVIEEGENRQHPVGTYGKKIHNRYNSSMTGEIPSKEEKSVDVFLWIYG